MTAPAETAPAGAATQPTGLAVEHTGFGADAVDYQSAWDLQRRVHADVAAGRAANTVLLLEHQPVYTAGRRTEAFERPSDGTPVVDVDAGGAPVSRSSLTVDESAYEQYSHAYIKMADTPQQYLWTIVAGFLKTQVAA